MKHEEIFERLEPPPGGLAKLRARLESRSSASRPARRGVRRFVLPLAFAAVAVAVILFFVGRRARDPLAVARLQNDGAEIALGLAPPPNAPVSVAGDSRATTALARVQTADPHVAFYWVSSTDWRD